MTTTEQIVLIHQGALGDFLMAWPTIASLRKYLPHTPIFWAGSPLYLPWLKPLHISMVTPALQKEIRTLHVCPEILPTGLKKSTIFWYVLRKKNDQSKHENIFFLQGIREGCWRSPRDLYAEALEKTGIPLDPKWLQTFRAALPLQPNRAEQTVLIFPGSGNPAKNWPLVQFFELAVWLKTTGLSPRIVLGPIEQEQWITPPPGLEVRRPQSLKELTGLLQRTSFVVGNDSGPMHLAGYMGLPGLALFGPTSPDQWAPLGLDILSRHPGCSPCTQTARITCKNPACIQNITLEQVQTRLIKRFHRQQLLPQKQNRGTCYP